MTDWYNSKAIIEWVSTDEGANWHRTGRSWPAAPGYALWDAGVMRTAAGWLAEPDAYAVRRFTIFFDFVPVWGDSTLAAELRSFVTSAMRQNLRLLKLMFTEAAHHKVPLTLFKGFVTEKSGPRKGQLDLKTSGLRFVARSKEQQTTMDASAPNQPADPAEIFFRDMRLSSRLSGAPA